MRLFILGNGFDLFHGLPTRYADFMLFMRRRYPQVVEDYLLGIDRYSLPYFGQVAQMPQDILWNDMERIFGSYEIWEMVEEHRDWNSPHDYTGPASERLHRILHLPIRIHEFLTEWLQTLQPQIQQTKPRPALQRLFGAGEDLFLNFNYTTTLEDVYNIPSVCHLHGKLGEKLIMGHGQTLGRVYFDDQEYGVNAVNDRYVFRYFRNSYKNCKRIMQQHAALFAPENLGAVSEIYIMGHSLNAIDLPYIRRLKRNCAKAAHWYILTRQNGQEYAPLLRHIPLAKQRAHWQPWSIFQGNLLAYPHT